jgi:prepilin-type N-terminal cleavage/methylation domain-containing protein/prepilin-type processing-associated H-X9-DG protein
MTHGTRARRNTRPTSIRQASGFTLIELLLVISIVALLVGILLPSLGSARNEGRAIKCAASSRAVGQAMLIYSTDYRFIPPSYVYPDEENGLAWSMSRQTGSDSATGYIHWSYMLFSGNTPEDAFECPSLWQGGAPRSNPGSKQEDSEDWIQNNDPNLVDRQVPRLAYAANDMLMPRNKFVRAGDVPRPYRLVKPSDLDRSANGSAKTILLAEFLNAENYRSLESPSQEGRIKSHRPITPVNSQGAPSYRPETLALTSGRIVPFRYPTYDASGGDTEVRPTDLLGRFMIEDAQTVLNAVGRHHPPRGGAFGGTTNYLFMDGHVERLGITETVEKRLWGDRFFSMTGDNRIALPTNVNR